MVSVYLIVFHINLSISLLPEIKFLISHVVPVFPWEEIEGKGDRRGDKSFLRKEQEMTFAL